MLGELLNIYSRKTNPMPKLTSNSLNGLVSELSGFHQHAHRFDTLGQTFGITPAEGLEFARPVFSSARNEMTWYTERSVSNARPLTTLSSEERKVAEMNYNQCLSAVRQRLAGMSNGEKRLEQFQKFTRLPDVSSIYVLSSGRGHSFVVVNWGMRDGSVRIDGGDTIVSISSAVRAIDEQNETALPNRQLFIKVGIEERFNKFTNSIGEVDLGDYQRKTRVVVSQPPREWVNEAGYNEQSFEVDSQAQQPMLFVWSSVAAVRVSCDGQPEEQGWKTLLFQSGSMKKNLNFSEESEPIIENLNAGEVWSISGQNDEEEKVLQKGQVQEGLNPIVLDFNLTGPEEKEEEEEDSESEAKVPTPPEKGPLHLRWESFWGRPLKQLPFSIQDADGDEELYLKTNDRGHSEVGDFSFHRKYDLSTKWWGRKWRFDVNHERDVAEHVLHLKAPIPWWLLATMGALLLLTLIGFWRVSYTPEIRLVNAETEAPIPNGVIEYFNFEGQRLVASSDEQGRAELLVGKRPFYKRLFQMNPSTPVQAVAPEYEPSRSKMDVRTWYWTQDWPLEPSHEVSLEIETYDAGNQIPLPGTYVELRTQQMDGSEESLFLGYSDANGKIEVVVDDRDFIVSNAQKASFVELNKLATTGKAILSGDENAGRIRLAPTVGCDERYSNESGSSTRVFDLGRADVDFCFQACNYTEMDRIVVSDANRQVLFDLDYSTNNELNPFKINDPSTYEQHILHSSTQTVYVEIRDGGTDWWFELNCSQSGCLEISRHPWGTGNPV